MRLTIAVTLAFIVVAGGLGAVVAVLLMIFNLAWELAESMPPHPRQQDDEQR